jgi:hypothetical protein
MYELGLLAYYGEGLEKEYAQKWLKEEKNAREDWINQVNSLQASLPSTEKLIIDYEKMKVSGVESGEFGSSMSIDSYNKRIAELQKQAGNIQNKVELGTIPTLDVTEPPKTSIFNQSMFPMVSAQNLSETGRVTGTATIGSAETKQGFILSSLGKASSFIERTPVLREIANPSLIGEELSSKYPKSTKAVSSFLFGSPESKTTQIWNPVLSLAVPTARLTNTIKFPTGVVREPSFFEVQQPAVIYGKPTTLSTYQLTREVSPSQFFMKNTKGSGLLFGEEGIIPARIETTIAPKIIGENPFRTYTTKFGQAVKFNELSGSSIPTNIQEFETFSNTQKLLWKRVAEDITGGRPVSMKNVPLILKQNEQMARGVIEQTNLGRYNLNNMKVTSAQLGRETSRYETASSFRKFSEGEKYDIFTGKVYFKDVTKPFSRASGKTPSMKGTIAVSKNPLIFGEENGVQVIRPSGTKRTLLSSTFQDNSLLTNQQDLYFKPSPMAFPKTAKVRGTQVLKKKGDILGYGRLAGVSVLSRGKTGGVSDSKLSGAYTDNLLSIRSQGRSEEMGIQGVLPQTSAKEDQNILTSQDNLIIQKNVLNLKPIEEQKPLERAKTITKQVQEPFQTQIPKQTSKLGTPQIEIFQQKQTTKPRTIQRTIPNKPVKPKVPTKPLFKTSMAKRVYNKIQEEPELIQIFGKRFGKDILLGKTTNKQKADIELEKFLRGGLGRSGFLESGGKRVESGLLKNFQYRPSKKEFGRVVQKAKYSLGTFPERKEIQMFKKQSKGKKKKKSSIWDF